VSQRWFSDWWHSIISIIISARTNQQHARWPRCWQTRSPVKSGSSACVLRPSNHHLTRGQAKLTSRLIDWWLYALVCYIIHVIHQDVAAAAATAAAAAVSYTTNSSYRLHGRNTSWHFVAWRLSCSIHHANDFEKTAFEVLTSLYQNACLLVLSLAGSFVNKNAIKQNVKVSVLLCHPRLRFWKIWRSKCDLEHYSSKKFLNLWVRAQ